MVHRPACPVREVVDAVLHLDPTGCSWRQLPHDFPPWSGVCSHFSRRAGESTTERVLAALGEGARDQSGRDVMAMPSLALTWADGRCSRRIGQAATALRSITLVVVAVAGHEEVAPLPRRWVVERTPSWIAGHRRFDHDDEPRPTHSQALITRATTGIAARRPAPNPPVLNTL